MQPDVRTFLQDILDEAASIRLYTQALSEDEFAKQKLVRDAVERCFIVIGEAVSNIRKLDVQVVSQISEWDRIIQFRNQLVHGYSDINDDITWRIVTTKLPIPVLEVDLLMKVIGTSAPPSKS